MAHLARRIGGHFSPTTKHRVPEVENQTSEGLCAGWRTSDHSQDPVTVHQGPASTATAVIVRLQYGDLWTK
jgi:hypothetical protein